MARAGIVAFVLSLLSAGTSLGHPLTFTATELVVAPDGRFVVEMVCDLDALALGVSQDSDDAELVAALRALTPTEFDDHVARLRRLFQRRVRVRFDNQPAEFEVTFPDHGTPAADDAEIPTILGLTARLSGTVPANAMTVEFFASRSFSDVHLSIRDEHRGVTRQDILERGARSDPFDLVGPVVAPRPTDVAVQYLLLGFQHIIPEGLDHILFVLSLFLLSVKLGPLVWQVTAFTVAHAVTLALAAFGFVDLPGRLVETIIALSIVYVAVENVLTPRLTLWRPIVVFGFGLLHGVGFADVLRELGLPVNDRLLGLIAFNVGIELGQLAVIATAFLAVGRWRNRPWYRPRVVIPTSIGIAGIGAVWAVERFIS